MSKIRFWTVAVVALTIAMAGCGGSQDTGAARADATLVIALPTQPDNLNPIFEDNVYAGNLKFFNGLLRYRPDLSPEPDLASALPTRSADGRTVTVKLRDDVTFSDRTSLTSKDVVFTYESILDPKVASPLVTLLDSVDHVKAVDPSTVEFDLNRPDPAFLDKLQIGIVPEHLLAGKDLKTAPYNTKPIGTGPYLLDEFNPGGRIVMVANERYFRGAPKIKRIVLTAVEDENARAAQLENGSIDLVGIIPKLAPRLRKDKDVNLYEVHTADARVIALPNRDPVTRDPRVRRALFLAIDRAKMVRGVLAGAGEPAFGPIMKGHWAYSPVAEKAFDPAEAASELDALGWRRPGGSGTRVKHGRKMSFKVMYPAGDSVRKDLALAFSSDMAKIGVDVRLEGLSFNVIKTIQDSGGTLFGYGTPYDPDIELYTLFDSKFASADGDAFTNYPRTQNKAIDASLDAERSILGQAKRKPIFARLQKQLSDDASWLWLVRLRHIVAASKRIHGIQPIVEPHAHGFSRGTSWNLEDWTLDPKS
jgi:peptide/nickel transport system substrate-binding protein